MAISTIPLGSINLSTRPNRRKAVSRIIGILHMTWVQEEAYMNRIPLNLYGSRVYAAAEDSLYHLTCAILALTDAY